MQTHVINLDKDKDRWQIIQQRLQPLGYDLKRFSGIHAKQLSTEKLNIYKQKWFNKRNKMSLSEMGCSISHLSLWDNIFNDSNKLKSEHESNVDKAIILEDDAMTYLEYHKLLKLLDNINGDPDIIYLGKCCDQCTRYEKIQDNIYRTYRPMCLHAYVLTRNGYNKIMNNISMVETIDTYLAKLIGSEKLIAYTFHPSIFVQDVLDIDSNLRRKSLTINNITDCNDYMDEKQGEITKLWTVVIILLILIVLIFIWYKLKY